MFNKISTYINLIIQQRKEKRIIKFNKNQFIKEKKEKQAIALVFNNRYTYRRLYVNSGELLEHTLNKQLAGNAWMCPDCNKIHMAITFNDIDGLQYPQCCSYPEGNRIYYDICI